MRILSFIAGLLLIGIVIYSGYYSSTHPSFVVWFGVLTALLSPLAFEFLLFPFKAKNKELISKLSKVPQIEKLIQEAKDNEEKIKLLEKQKEELDRLIAYESKRRTLEAEKKIYIIQGNESLKNLQRVNLELEQLTKEKQSLPDFILPLLEATSQPEENTIKYKIKGRVYIIRKSELGALPVYGNIFFEILKGFETLFKIDKRINSFEQNWELLSTKNNPKHINDLVKRQSNTEQKQ